MKLESINCNHCGAPLEVAENARFVTCRHCDTQLAIKRTKSAAFTEEIERLSNTTDRLSDQLAQISYDNALDRLDRDWERERKRYMGRNKDGGEYVPTAGSAIAIAVIGGLMGLFILASNFGGGGFIGLLFIALALLGGASSYLKAQKYTQAEKRYRRRRRSLSLEQFRQQDDEAADSASD